MENLYEKNGLVFWNFEEIQLRKMFEDYFLMKLSDSLKQQNKAFEFMQIEAPILTPKQFINQQYTSEDIYQVDDLCLRPETTMGSYVYAKMLLTHHKGVKLPLVIWQHGKSFRREQDQVVKNMRLKEFYQMEFQIIYSLSTANDYSVSIIPTVCDMISNMIGSCHVEDSDRIPYYSESTKDVICDKTNMEVCSISKRNDFENAKVLEIAIGTDRCVYNFLNR